MKKILFALVAVISLGMATEASAGGSVWKGFGTGVAGAAAYDVIKSASNRDRRYYRRYHRPTCRIEVVRDSDGNVIKEIETCEYYNY